MCQVCDQSAIVRLSILAICRDATRLTINVMRPAKFEVRVVEFARAIKTARKRHIKCLLVLLSIVAGVAPSVERGRPDHDSGNETDADRCCGRGQHGWIDTSLCRLFWADASSRLFCQH